MIANMFPIRLVAARSPSPHEGAMYFGSGICMKDLGDENEDDVAEVFGDFEEGDGSSWDEMQDTPIEEDTETTKARGFKQPAKPTCREVEEHELTHAEFRDWCEECVKGKGRKDQHRRTAEEKEENSDTISTFSIDYMYLTEQMEIITEDEAEKTNVLLGKLILVGHDR